MTTKGNQKSLHVRVWQVKTAVHKKWRSTHCPELQVLIRSVVNSCIFQISLYERFFRSRPADKVFRNLIWVSAAQASELLCIFMESRNLWTILVVFPASWALYVTNHPRGNYQLWPITVILISSDSLSWWEQRLDCVLVIRTVQDCKRWECFIISLPTMRELHDIAK